MVDLNFESTTSVNCLGISGTLNLTVTTVDEEKRVHADISNFIQNYSDDLIGRNLITKVTEINGIKITQDFFRRIEFYRLHLVSLKENNGQLDRVIFGDFKFPAPTQKCLNTINDKANDIALYIAQEVLKIIYGLDIEGSERPRVEFDNTKRVFTLNWNPDIIEKTYILKII